MKIKKELEERSSSKKQEEARGLATDILYFII
jgi:hypothetical protein